MQALCAAARDGVDVRLLVPGASDIPILRLFSRAGYRPLLEAGVRVFEWNGAMLHAKSAVADGRWARVGSTNLNIASWMGNRELDVVIEDEPFAAGMEAMYLEDLDNATEVILDARKRVRAPNAPKGHARTGQRRHRQRRSRRRRRGADRQRRVGGHHQPARARTGRVAHRARRRRAAPCARRSSRSSGRADLSWPLAVVFTWLALALLYRGFTLHARHD